MKTLTCRCGKEILLDDIDYEELKDRSFYCNEAGTVRTELRERGRFKKYSIAQLLVGDDYDHKDRNKHNNQRDNLRKATRKEQQGNQGLRKNNSSGYKGVYFNKKDRRWVANISIDGKTTFLGGFPNPEDAARCYNQAAKQHFGNFACVNDV